MEPITTTAKSVVFYTFLVLRSRLSRFIFLLLLQAAIDFYNLLTTIYIQGV
jgi:hypothetical protein